MHSSCPMFSSFSSSSLSWTNYQCSAHSHDSSQETFLLACFFHTFVCLFFFIHFYACLYVFFSYICMRFRMRFCHTFVCDFVCVFFIYLYACFLHTFLYLYSGQPWLNGECDCLTARGVAVHLLDKAGCFFHTFVCVFFIHLYAILYAFFLSYAYFFHIFVCVFVCFFFIYFYVCIWVGRGAVVSVVVQ